MDINIKEKEDVDIIIREKEDYILVQICAIHGVSPGELPQLLESVKNEVSRVYQGRGVVISIHSGFEVPGWLHSALAHAVMWAPWVAHYDRYLGAVVAVSHDTDHPVGSIIKVYV